MNEVLPGIPEIGHYVTFGEKGIVTQDSILAFTIRPTTRVGLQGYECS